MLSLSDLTRIVTELSELADLDKSIDHVTSSARWLFGADEAGVTLIKPGAKLETVAPTADLAARADSMQHELGEGPCIDAATEAQIVRTDDPANDERWPRWGPAIAELGVRSSISVDLVNQQLRLGALNLYGKRHEQFAHLDPDELRTYATHVMAVLGATHRIESLETALETRTVIGQAEGMLMERFSIDAVTAFAVLRRASQQSNVKLRDLAEQLVQKGDISGILGDRDH
ncbi:GAF and ANTAR domain-containing protein [Aeromicrobium camelliae]|uniref:GAF and ANTAR domain-containing protein n=1 Tax=Aeromicrobium camelliae TaxID=1538144 RepID=UPI00140A211C|nr:GAF and ANTAR domain-containing protein [Aeromicrobium camelliae]